MQQQIPTPRMRTLPKAFEEVKRLDPDTALSLGTFRRVVKKGVIPITEVGSRRLINLDLLFEALNLSSSCINDNSNNERTNNH